MKRFCINASKLERNVSSRAVLSVQVDWNISYSI